MNDFSAQQHTVGYVPARQKYDLAFEAAKMSALAVARTARIGVQLLATAIEDVALQYNMIMREFAVGRPGYIGALDVAEIEQLNMKTSK